jgi:hypothetical protein
VEAQYPFFVSAHVQYIFIVTSSELKFQWLWINFHSCLPSWTMSCNYSWMLNKTLAFLRAEKVLKDRPGALARLLSCLMLKEKRRWTKIWGEVRLTRRPIYTRETPCLTLCSLSLFFHRIILSDNKVPIGGALYVCSWGRSVILDEISRFKRLTLYRVLTGFKTWSRIASGQYPIFSNCCPKRVKFLFYSKLTRNRLHYTSAKIQPNFDRFKSCQLPCFHRFRPHQTLYFYPF